MEYLEKADIDALGLDTTGFYDGYVNRNTCYYCHAIEDEYVYYTCINGVCYANVHVVYKYEGNEVSPADELTIDYKYKGHPHDNWYTEYNADENPADKTAIEKYVKDIMGELLIDIDYARLTTYGCRQCGYVSREELDAYKYDSDDSLYASIELFSYYEDGEFANASGWCYDDEFILDKYASLIAQFDKGSGAVDYAELYLRVNSNHKLSYKVEIDYENGDELDIEVGTKGTKIVYFYDYSACGEGMNVVRSYYGANGELLDQEKSTRHDWEMVFSGVHCLEDGEYFEECASCGEIDEMDSEKRTHRSSTSWVYEINLIGLDEEYDEIVHMRGERCDYCYKIFNCKIELKSDWTLTENVYIYAEDIVFDFNGHTVDLNGYELVIYGFAGSDVRLYDSIREGIPEEELEANVIDTAGDGWLVVFSDYGYLNGGDNEILLGAGMSTASNVNYFLTDCENYLTIEDAIYEEYGAQLDTNFDFFAE